MRNAVEWAQVRALAADGVSKREIARRLGINRRKVASSRATSRRAAGARRPAHGSIRSSRRCTGSSRSGPDLVASGNPARILVFTTFDLDEYVYAAIRAGASGCLLKDVRPADLVDGIRLVAGGDALLGPTITRPLLEHFADTHRNNAQEAAPGLKSLTDREHETLRLLAAGLSNYEIAERLVLSKTTVKRMSPTSCASLACATASRR